jgi:molybdopterin converting factor small subunit
VDTGVTPQTDIQANEADRVLAEIKVELFGVPRLLAGQRVLSARGETLARLTSDLASRWPVLLGQVIDPATEWLLPGYAFVVDERFTSDAQTALTPESSVLLVSSVAGGRW